MRRKIFVDPLIPKGKSDKLSNQSLVINDSGKKQINFVQTCSAGLHNYGIFHNLHSGGRMMNMPWMLYQLFWEREEVQNFTRIYRKIRGLYPRPGSDFWLLRNAGVFFMESTCDPRGSR